MRRLAIFTMCFLALAACASADMFSFTYTGSNLIADVHSYSPIALPTGSCEQAGPPEIRCSGASGQLAATNLGGGVWRVDSGSGTYHDPTGASHAIAIAPGSGSDQYFIWDNLIFPQFSPRLDNPGLLFNVDGGLSAGGQELNIFGWNPGQLYYALTAPPAWEGDAGGFTLTRVPDGGMTIMLLGCGLFALETLRRKLGV